MSEFTKKKKLGSSDEIAYAKDNSRLDEDLPVGTIFPPSELVAVVKPKKMMGPYLEILALFLCAVISIGCDAFIFSSSLFGEIFAKVDNTFTTIVTLVCLLVHLVPELFWGLNLYRRFTRIANYTVIVTTDKIIACGRAHNTESRTIVLEDLTDVVVKKSTVTLTTTREKLKIGLNDPEAFKALVEELYENL